MSAPASCSHWLCRDLKCQVLVPSEPQRPHLNRGRNSQPPSKHCAPGMRHLASPFVSAHCWEVGTVAGLQEDSYLHHPPSKTTGETSSLRLVPLVAWRPGSSELNLALPTDFGFCPDNLWCRHHFSCAPFSPSWGRITSFKETNWWEGN